MDQVASFEEFRKHFRAQQIAHFIDKVEPRRYLYSEVLSNGGFTLSDEQFTELRFEYWKLCQLVKRCYVESWDYGVPEQQTEEEVKQYLQLGGGLPEIKYGVPEQQTEEEAEHGIDLLLLELLTYEVRPVLVLWLLPGKDLQEIWYGKALQPAWNLAADSYPEVFERWSIRLNSAKEPQ